MALKAVLFDLGNTLITYPNPDEVALRFHEKAAEIAADPRMPKVDYLVLLSKLSEKYLEARKASFQTLKEATFAESLKFALEELGIEMSRGDQEDLLFTLSCAFFTDVSELIPGTLEILEFLDQMALKIAVISNTPWTGEDHLWDMHYFGIMDADGRWFPCFWSSYEGIRKPNPELFRKALAELKVTSDEAIYVGDNFSRDVVGPNSISMKAIWISNKPVPEGQTLNGWQVANLVEAKTLIEGLIKEGA